MQLYLDESMRIFVLRQMKSVESMVIKEYPKDSEEQIVKDAKLRRQLIDEKISSVFENAEKRSRK